METGIVKLNPELLALLGSGTSSGIQPFAREIFVLNEFVAGTTYCENIEDVIDQVTPGTLLKMRRDSDNEVDEYAISIYVGTTRIGWVPMKQNLVIARLMDAGKAFTCKVVKVTCLGSWWKINVSIYMIDS